MAPKTEPLRLLAILAHPDDETLGIGGVLARYAAEGVEIHLVTATRGEGGRFRGLKDGAGHPGKEKLAAIREEELRAAASVLGIRSVTLLEYGDGRLDEADPREAIARIAAEIRRLATAGPTCRLEALLLRVVARPLGGQPGERRPSTGARSVRGAPLAAPPREASALRRDHRAEATPAMCRTRGIFSA